MTLNYSRSLVAKECINRVCDIANIRSPKKRRVEKRIQQVSHTMISCFIMHATHNLFFIQLI